MNTSYLGGTNIKRLTRNVARKQFQQGAAIIVVPVKMWPGSIQMLGVHSMGMKLDAADLAARYPGQEYTFDSLVNQYAHANCCYETGYYPAFYIEG